MSLAAVIYPSSYANVTTVTVSTTSTVLLAENKNRKYFYVFNDSGAVIYLKFNTGATTASFSVRIANNAGESFMMPYHGVVHAVRGAGSGPVQVTEFI